MRRVRRARSPSAPIGMDPRLAAAMAALARDRQLLELVEDAEQLTPGAKRPSAVWPEILPAA